MTAVEGKRTGKAKGFVRRKPGKRGLPGERLRDAAAVAQTLQHRRGGENRNEVYFRRQA